MKKILFATEYAEHASRVFGYALAMADILKGRIIMVHAFGLPDNPEDNPDFEEREKEEGKKLRDFQWENTPERYTHLKIDKQARVGFPKDVILKVAEEEEVDLIVVGTRGKTNAVQKFLGGVSNAVMDSSPCPILLVPPSARLKSIKQMGATTAFDFDDLFIFNTTIDLAKKFKSHVHFLHIVENEEALELAKEKMAIIKRTFLKTDNINYHLKQGDIVAGIQEFVKKERLDLLGMIHHHQSFFNNLVGKNIADDVANEINIPLLVINGKS